MSDQPIKLDLRKLTQAHVDVALPLMGECRYAAPCIIGTLIPERDRARLDNPSEDPDDELNPIISELCSRGLVEFPCKGQLRLAEKLQTAFDNGGTQDFRAALAEVNKKLGLNLGVPKP